MVYQIKKGSYLSIDAQVAGEECEKLAAENRLTAANLVEVSRPKNAPLHNAFEWNNRIASEKWREHQARNIINSIEVVYEQQEPVRAFFNIVRTEAEYKPLDTILRNETDKGNLLKTALGELRAFEKKYKQLTELAELFGAIERLGEALAS